jgi:hypothetical protein
LNVHLVHSGLEISWIIWPEFNVSSRRVVRNYAEAIYESNYVAAMIERRPTRRRSRPRDNRWRRTLPEANILIRKLLGLSTSKFLDAEFGIMDFGASLEFRVAVIRHRHMSHLTND